LVAVFFTALLDESVQQFVPTRSFALRDLVTDGIGGFVAVAIARWFYPWRDGQN
jgi:VanZ family protein